MQKECFGSKCTDSRKAFFAFRRTKPYETPTGEISLCMLILYVCFFTRDGKKKVEQKVISLEELAYFFKCCH